MSRHRKSKSLLKLEERFQAGVTAYLETLGARAGRFYKLELDTPAGLLHISVYGDWIACRFDDVDLGKRFTHFSHSRLQSSQRQVEFHLRNHGAVRS